MTQPGASAGEPVRCSAKGCPADARWVLVWNNPKVHTPDREKTWVACDLHRGSLSDFLDLRGFLRRVDPLAAVPAPGALRCPECGASLPPSQNSCPVCADVRTGSCGSPSPSTARPGAP